MRLNYLAFAVPLFTGLMLLEFFFSRRKARRALSRLRREEEFFRGLKGELSGVRREEGEVLFGGRKERVELTGLREVDGEEVLFDGRNRKEDLSGLPGFGDEELLLDGRKAAARRELFDLRETVANLNVGIMERLSDVFMAGIFYFFFSWLYRHFALFDIRPGVWTWMLLFLFTDLLWYWYHRAGHEVNLFWSAHVVHHQSEDFNYTVSARITVFQAAARCLFWGILPLIGFPPGMITVFLLIHGTYPFFTHTQLVGKLGWLEYILVTPSHHRVHHSSNPAYLDKNYGDMLIIWDKLFGTFAVEEEEPVYGLTKPLDSHSFLWQHFHFMLEMWISVTRARGVRKKLAILFGKPDLIDVRIRPALERKLISNNQGRALTPSLLNYIKIQTVLTLGVLFLVILFEYNLSGSQLLILSLFILLSVVTTGAMLEQRQWIFHLEVARFGLLNLLLWISYPDVRLGLVSLALSLVVLSFYKTIGKEYYHYLYNIKYS